MSRKYLGLDIQPDALCAVIIEGTRKTRSVNTCMLIPFAGSDSFQDDLDEAFHILTEKTAPGGTLCTMSIPIDRVSCRNLQVPFSDGKKIRQVLPFELEPLLPFPIEDLIIDFQMLDSVAEGTNLLVMVAVTDMLKPFIDTAAAFQLDPETLLPGTYATGIHLAATREMPPNWMLLDVHAERSGFLVIADHKVCLMRSIPVSLSSPEAGSAICRQIKQTMAGIDSFMSTDRDESDFSPALLLMTGPRADHESLATLISQALDLPVDRLNLFEKNRMDTKETLTPEVSPQRMNNALACALLAAEGSRGNLNLRQAKLSPKSRFFEHRQAIVRTAIMVGVATLFALGNLLAEITMWEREATELNQQVVSLFKSVLPDAKAIVEPVHQLQVEIEELKKKTFGTADTGGYLPAIDILFYLSQDIPASIDVKITKLVLGDQNILISGSTDSFNSVNEMKGQLEKNKLFKIVKINSADMEQAEKRVRFKMQIQL